MIYLCYLLSKTFLCLLAEISYVTHSKTEKLSDESPLPSITEIYAFTQHTFPQHCTPHRDVVRPVCHHFPPCISWDTEIRKISFNNKSVI